MRLGRLLFQQGYTKTINRKSGNTSQLVEGIFNPEFPYGDGGSATLLGRYGQRQNETAGTVEGEAGNVDPEVIRRWLAAEGSRIFPAANIPDVIDVADLRQISKDGRTTAFGELVKPWLLCQQGEAAKPPADDPAGDKASALELLAFAASLPELVKLIKSLPETFKSGSQGVFGDLEEALGGVAGNLRIIDADVRRLAELQANQFKVVLAEVRALKNQVAKLAKK